MARLLHVFLIGLLLAGCDTDHARHEEAWHKIRNVADNTREAGDYEHATKEIQELAAKGYPIALLNSVWMTGTGYLPKNSNLLEANLHRLNELGYVDAKERLAYFYGAGSGEQPPNADKAIHWHQEYLTTGYGEGGLPALYLDGVLIPTDLDKAETLLAKQLDRASLPLLEMYGNLLLERGGDRLSEAYVMFKVLEQLSIDYLDGGETLQFYEVSEAEKLEISVKASDWQSKIINPENKGSRLWNNRFSVPRHGFPQLGSVTKLERHLREQAALGASEFQFLLARYLFSEYAGFNEPRMVEALHFAERAAAQNHLPAVSLVAEIHLSKPNLSKVESSQYVAEMVSALERGYFDRADYLVLYAYRQFEKHGDRQALILAQALSILEVELRKDYYADVLAALDNQLTATEIADALNEAASYEFSPLPEYSNRPDAWPSSTYLFFGVTGIAVSVFVFYLGGLVYRARRAESSKNVYAGLVLCCDSYLILVITLTFTLPSSFFAQDIVQGLAHVVPIAVLGSMLGFYGLACQIETNFSRFLNLKIVKYGLACAAVCLFAYLTIDPLRVSQGYAWESWQPPLKVSLSFDGGLTVYTNTTGRLLVMMACWSAMLLTLLAATIAGLLSRKVKNRVELTYYLKAYGAFFLMAVVPISIFFVLFNTKTWGYWYIMNNGIPPTVYSTSSLLLFAVFLSLGILRNQAFGIERVFRRNTVRAVLGGIGLASFFLAENIVENHVEEDYGTFGGLVAALLIFGFQNRLALVLRPFVNSLFSDEMDQPFSEQMTTYMHLYRTAMLDHIITEEEQTLLTATAKGLNLNSTEIEAVEESVKLELGSRRD